MDDVTGSEIEIKPFPSRGKIHFSLLFSFLATMFGLIGTIWQHTSAVTAATLLAASTSGAIKAHVGAAATSFAWVGTILFFVALTGMAMLRMSVSALESMTDDDDPEAEGPDDSSVY